MATSEIPQTPANFDLGSRHTKAFDTLRVIDVGFVLIILVNQVKAIQINRTGFGALCPTSSVQEQAGKWASALGQVWHWLGL